MSLPTLIGTGRLTSPPEVRFSGNGTAVCKLNLAFNARKRDQNGDWVDGDTCFLSATCFNQLAEQAGDALDKGTEVVVIGRLKTSQWETDQGEKRSMLELLVDSLGPSVRSNNLTVERTHGRSSGDGQPAATAASSYADDEVPF